MPQFTRRAVLLGAGSVVVLGAGGVTAAVLNRPQQAAPVPIAPSTPVAETSATPPPTPSPTPTPVDPRPRWPLTGELLKSEKDAHHPAVAVKVPDNRFEHPQQGIDQADIVFVELEGYRDAQGYSATRLVPVFHSRYAETVAPVRSIRPVDVALLSPMDAIIGNTGAAPWVVAYVQHNRAHLEGMLSFVNTLRTGSYGTNQARVYTQNGQTYYDRAITCHPAVLAKQTKRFADGPPQLYFPFATSVDTVSTDAGKAASAISIPYQGSDYRMSYAYDKSTKRYLRSEPWGPHVMADGTRISVDNVLVIKAKQHYGKIFKGVGHEEPLHDTIDAQGAFYYCHRGKYVTGTWRKGKITEPFVFTLAGGQPLKMASGQTFVELPDDGAKVVVTA